VKNAIGKKLEQVVEGLCASSNGIAGVRLDTHRMRLGVSQQAEHTGWDLTEETLMERLVEVGIPAWRVTISKAEVCISCDGAIEGAAYDNESGPGKLCEACWEYDRSEHVTTVRFSDSDDPLDVRTIGMYHNDTEGEFETEWVSDGGWQGHSVIKPSKNWKLLRSDAILSMSEDAQNLAEFDKATRAQLKKMGIRWARVISPTSNIFCCGYDFYVEAKHFKKAEKFVKMFAQAWRKDEDFVTTALTGKNPRECTPTDRAFTAIASNIIAKAKEGGQ